jgi:hypothetical protein
VPLRSTDRLIGDKCGSVFRNVPATLSTFRPLLAESHPPPGVALGVVLFGPIDVQALPITQAVSIGERMPASRNQCAALVMAVFTTLRRDPNSFSP